VAVQPNLIVPCDDGVVWQLHEIHTRYPALRPLIERSLGSNEGYPFFHSRAAFLQAAKEIGIRVPVTSTVTSEASVTACDIHAKAVLKLDGTWGGSGVVIVRSVSEALTAFRRFFQPLKADLAWKRWLINRDPLALWSWRRQEEPRLTIQEFIQGRPANAMIACWQGEVLGCVSVEVLTSQGATGAALVVRLIQNEEIEQAAQRLARRFMLSGFHGLDFVLEQNTGAAYLIEINPRCTQLGHLHLPIQGDLAGAISAKLWNKPIEVIVPDVKDWFQGGFVAFFPQAFKCNPHSPHLRNGNHDVPWEEPALVFELLRNPWPERQWLSRVYHYYRKPIYPGEVNCGPS
jgi:predicted ATP-grasp superfamily ATP-dependent carboligase